MKKLIILFPAILFLAACAHHRDVRPGVNGTHRVVIKAEEQGNGAENAIAQANHFCEERYKNHAAILQEDNKYVGSMKEEDYKRGKTVAKVASAAGSALWVFGGKNESAVGGVTAIGGGIANNALGQGYIYEMSFRCVN